MNNWLFKNPIAHRGLHSKDICENSMSAFMEAVKHNYAIELDIQFTQDKEVVVFHDKSTKRLTSKRYNITQTSYANIKNLKLLKTQDSIPLLQDVLKEVNGKVPLVIEIKNEKSDGVFENKIAQILDEYNGSFVVKSFNVQSVAWFKNNRMNFTRGLIFSDKKGLRAFIKFLYAYIGCKPHFVSLDFALLDSLIVTFCKWMKTRLFCWTIKSQTKAKKALTLVDNIIFEKIRP